MINTKKTGSPQEIAQTMRKVAKTLDSMPNHLIIKIEINIEVLSPPEAERFKKERIQ